MTIIPELTKVQKLTLNRAIELLVALKFPFAIVDSTGLVHGGLEIKNDIKKRERKYPHGQRSKYAAQFVSIIEVGQEICVPCDIYDIEDLRKSITSLCHQKWGASSIVSTLNRDQNHVEILRVK